MRPTITLARTAIIRGRETIVYVEVDREDTVYAASRKILASKALYTKGYLTPSEFKARMPSSPWDPISMHELARMFPLTWKVEEHTRGCRLYLISHSKVIA